MRGSTFLAAAFCAAPAGASAGAAGEPEPKGSLPPPGTYLLDPPHTFVYFDARHKVVGLVRGRFDKSSGTVVVVQQRRVRAEPKLTTRLGQTTPSLWSFRARIVSPNGAPVVRGALTRVARDQTTLRECMSFSPSANPRPPGSEPGAHSTHLTR
jgi:hypothetical protein